MDLQLKQAVVSLCLKKAVFRLQGNSIAITLHRTSSGNKMRNALVAIALIVSVSGQALADTTTRDRQDDVAALTEKKVFVWPKLYAAYFYRLSLPLQASLFTGFTRIIWLPITTLVFSRGTALCFLHIFPIISQIFSAEKTPTKTLQFTL